MRRRGERVRHAQHEVDRLVPQELEPPRAVRLPPRDEREVLGHALLGPPGDERGVRRLLPGHGPVIDDPAGVLDGYLAHRAERLEQVRAAVAAGAVSARDVVERVYADVDESLWPAAEQSVAAQLAYLQR